MIGVRVQGGSARVRDDLPRPARGARGVLVRVRLAGICGTDLELLRGYAGFSGTPGHEFVGVVDEGPAHWLDARVVSEINIGCDARAEPDPCRPCAAGRPAHCDRRDVLGIRGRDGAFAELVAVPVANLHRVPDGVSDEAAVFVEPLAAALRVMEQVRPAAGTPALVVGDGRLGQLVARVLALEGCEVTVVGRHRGKLERLSGREGEWRDRIRGVHAPEGREKAALAPRSFELAVECSGSPTGFAAARRALRPLGTLVLKSTHAAPLTHDVSALVLDELTVIGSRCGPFAPALRLLEEGTLDLASLIDGRFPLREAVAALERAGEPGVLKVLLEP